MKKKSKTPFALRIIPVIFPWIERLTPNLANRFFAHLFFTPIGYSTPQKELKSETFAEKFILSVNGMQIQCYRWGNAPKTVLVVHGWAGRATQFRRFVKPLIQSGYQVVGFDGPAHGKSSGKSTHLNEFLTVIQALENRYRKIDSIIAHSFGGVASLYAIAEGLKVNSLIAVASPTIADEIINTYLKALGGSLKTGKAFKEFVLQKYGKPFEEFSSLTFIKRVPSDFNLLLVHDDNDQEVSMDHPNELIKIFPQARIYKTSGLGHTRILRDNDVIREVVTFIRSHSSES
ncbi:MAG: alpha/beta hydrolase [Flammeovirgaceae bacterium]|nr:alpha/beta hydrolase [Flammeovirgaceae bacterium]